MSTDEIKQSAPLVGVMVCLSKEENRYVFVGRNQHRENDGVYFEFVNGAVATRIHMSDEAAQAIIELVPRVLAGEVDPYVTTGATVTSYMVAAHWEEVRDAPSDSPEVKE